MRVPPGLFIVLMTLLVAVSLCAAAPAPNGAAQPESESFAGAFFIAHNVNADGTRSIELFGTLIIWLLMTLSMANLGLIGYFAMNNQRKAFVPEEVVTEVRRLLSGGDYRAALKLARKDQSFYSQAVSAGLGEAGHGFAAIVRAMQQKADVLTTVRMRPIELLYMFGQVSPMLGLLGTVYGIIFAFRVFVSMGGHASPALLAGGIGTALVATFWGLVVAIPALAGYSILRNKVDQLTMEATVAAEETINQFKPKAASPAATGKQRTAE